MVLDKVAHQDLKENEVNIIGKWKQGNTCIVLEI